MRNDDGTYGKGDGVARDTGGGPCACDGPARTTVPDTLNGAIAQAKVSDPAAENYCFCEVKQTTGAAETSCQNGRSSGKSASSARSPVSVRADHSRIIGRKTS